MLGLSERLSLIYSLVPENSCVCDVGTDHGYLPAALCLNAKMKSVTATDIRRKPLENARENIKKLGADGVNLILCDGLDGVSRDLADVVIIAGMGGEVISGIMSRCYFANDSTVTFILQPMTCADKLREFLCENGFYTESEIPIKENGKIYSVIKVRYCGISEKIDNVTKVIGKVTPDSEYGRQYIKKQYDIAKKCEESLKYIITKKEDYCRYREIRERLGKILEENNGI